MDVVTRRAVYNGVVLSVKCIASKMDTKLTSTVQRVSDNAKGVAIRVAKIENVAIEDNEKTIADLQARIQKTIEILESVKAEDFNANEDAEVVLPTKKGELKYTSKSKFLLSNIAI